MTALEEAKERARPVWEQEKWRGMQYEYQLPRPCSDGIAQAGEKLIEITPEAGRQVTAPSMAWNLGLRDTMKYAVTRLADPDPAMQNNETDSEESKTAKAAAREAATKELDRTIQDIQKTESKLRQMNAEIERDEASKGRPDRMPKGKSKDEAESFEALMSDDARKKLTQNEKMLVILYEAKKRAATLQTTIEGWDTAAGMRLERIDDSDDEGENKTDDPDYDEWEIIKNDGDD
jgi:hypothetical protein